jgi:hypothetical protein
LFGCCAITPSGLARPAVLVGGPLIIASAIARLESYWVAVLYVLVSHTPLPTVIHPAEPGVLQAQHVDAAGRRQGVVRRCPVQGASSRDCACLRLEVRGDSWGRSGGIESCSSACCARCWSVSMNGPGRGRGVVTRGQGAKRSASDARREIAHGYVCARAGLSTVRCQPSHAPCHGVMVLGHASRPHCCQSIFDTDGKLFGMLVIICGGRAAFCVVPASSATVLRPAFQVPVSLPLGFYSCSARGMSITSWLALVLMLPVHNCCCVAVSTTLAIRLSQIHGCEFWDGLGQTPTLASSQNTFMLLQPTEELPPMI